jgi:prevent-host-death family protein
MNEIGAFEAKNTLGRLLDRVERGEEIVITRHGRAVARLIPHTRMTDQTQIQAAFERIRARAPRLRRSQSERAAFDWAALKKLRDQGRP